MPIIQELSLTIPSKELTLPKPTATQNRVMAFLGNRTVQATLATAASAFVAINTSLLTGPSSPTALIAHPTANPTAAAYPSVDLSTFSTTLTVDINAALKNAISAVASAEIFKELNLNLHTVEHTETPIALNLAKSFHTATFVDTRPLEAKTDIFSEKTPSFLPSIEGIKARVSAAKKAGKDVAAVGGQKAYTGLKSMLNNAGILLTATGNLSMNLLSAIQEAFDPNSCSKLQSLLASRQISERSSSSIRFEMLRRSCPQ
ncbi:MAG: hypothetical protein S4CHLAM6_09070 [Chlamydiae bacterium]|nr:hypothetical protein [Chlamydiota bacterium]